MSSSEPDPLPRDGSDDWTVYLDPNSAPTEEPPAPVRLGRWTAAGLLIAVVAASAVLWGPEVDTGEDPPPVAAVLGSHLAVPIALHLPADAVATADGSYVGVQFPAGGVVLVTVPTEVVNPSGVQTPLPADPAAWLAGHPAVFVSRVKNVKVGGVTATQVDYQRARTDAPLSQFARLPLFCGWRTDSTSSDTDAALTTSQICTQITADARVRATFVRLGTQTVLVEAVWRASGVGSAAGSDARTGTTATVRMPRELRRSYASLLAGLTPTSARATG